MTIEERFWSRVDKTATCWLWTGHLGPCGHGAFTIGREINMTPHRWSYIDAGHEIPDGWVIHHLCQVPNCVRPDHLQAVTRAQHNLIHGRELRSHCKNGHEFTEETVYWWNGPKGVRRICRVCGRLNKRRQAAGVAGELGR